MGSPDAELLWSAHGGLETAAQMLEVSVSTIKRRERDHELPVVHIGKAVRIRVADLEAFVLNLGATGEENVA